MKQVSFWEFCSPRDVCFRPSGRQSRQLMTDSVEKVGNEPTAKFRDAAVQI
ncbi:MAG: hypothetical protein WBE90_30270 [Xanthobacteraceae bacterium]